MDIEENKRLTLKEKRQKIASNYETIEVLKNRLKESKGQQKGGMSRAAYIKMIFDVTKKVDEQNKELIKVITDTRKLKKDINNLNVRLERNFSLVEDTILKNGKHFAWSQECYRLLKTMHQNCDQLIRAVQETCEMTQEIRQLEDQIGQLKVTQSYGNN